VTELKKCPFCGKEQSETNFFSCDGYPQACGCWEMTTTGEEAEKVWNTRPIEDELCAELEKRTAELHYANTACMEMKHELDRLNAELLELNDKAVFIKFENEDELPAEIKDDVYSAMFECSHVDGVRLFPYIEENGQKYFLVMIEEENKSRLVYIVTMYRYGDREKHSYVLGAFSTENDARECGEKEKDYRGGKYEPEIIKFYVDSQRIDDFVGDSDHEHDDRIL